MCVRVLGIESTCDETGIALVRNGREILANVVASQEDLHQMYGGVIPELACRRHIDVCLPLLETALKQAQITFEEIDLIAVAKGPGLIGALLIGLNFAKGLALASGKPLIGVNHCEAHLYAVMMEHQVPLPALGVVVSGGHTLLVEVEAVGIYKLLGQTQDDAIGEAFDKVARLLELPYPGGPQIEKLARQGNPHRYPFKGGRMKNNPFDFSFSGLKTAVFYQVKGQNASKNAPLLITEEEKADVAASFQHGAFSYLVEKITLAAQQRGSRSILIGGGVSQNQYLRALLETHAPCPLFWPPPGLILDNAAMIAGLGLHTYQRQGRDSLQLEAITRTEFYAHHQFNSPTCSVC
ncbi:tRNA (adenosine(37)-N6)-threonylcarbamoyltransferase complex transferase subunit TsaD [Chlamydiota bacterium]